MSALIHRGRATLAARLRKLADRLVPAPPPSSRRPAGTTLSREQVIWAFRVLFDREPNEHDITTRLECWGHMKELRRELLATDEFRACNPRYGFTNASNVVIKELTDEVRLFVDLADWVIGGNVLAGNYEPAELALMQRTVQAGQTVLDIGANIGFFTMHLASLVGAAGRVYAFEPLASNLALLRRSLAENGFEERVVLTPAIVSAATGKRRLAHLEIKRALNSGGAWVLNEDDAVPAGHEATEVPTVVLDQCEIRRPVSFVKIDIEGSELVALRGADEILRTDQPPVLAELNADQLAKVSQATPEQLIAEMADRGYACHLLTADGPGDAITSYDAPEICSVLFLPDSASTPHA